jgi:hypothetical protein
VRLQLSPRAGRLGCAPKNFMTSNATLHLATSMSRAARAQHEMLRTACEAVHTPDDFLRNVWDSAAAARNARSRDDGSAFTLLARCSEIESDLDMVEPRQADMEQGAGCCSMPGGRLDDIEMDAMARGALLRPIFGAGAARDHAQDDQLRIATGTSRANR